MFPCQLTMFPPGFKGHLTKISNTKHEKPYFELLARVVQEILRTLQVIAIAPVAPEVEGTYSLMKMPWTLDMGP